ncbi:AraC family transcriptional regulator [Rhizobium sp. SSA_523]|uniref:AraC family transcriptional regulator n=1 Tax=Rhizobium sp. SSA_523 TaxID=2952477 RepID=UPI002090F06A|nr:AraC family transcriptional regulator [Rhizobium sp. SSA_523]MCO5731332.1 AraC family transcriptional regulator [Rhizobium sp. SSA_523]WKC22137.1 AraC family transcriptional regulator [Rhizobium sp. SSA_523]
MQANSVQGIEGDEDLAPAALDGLERSCKARPPAAIRSAIPSHGVERIEARFHGTLFAPHRHDTYALGLTLRGVQTFRYRGRDHFSNAGNVIVLHPDELHDGAAGTEDGLIYRMIYLPPTMISGVNGHRQALPFVADPVLSDAGLRQALAEILADLEEEPDALAMDDVVMRLAAGLSRQSGAPGKPVHHLAQTGVLRARDFLDSHFGQAVDSEMLEAETGLNRYELARQFRRLMGTSPHRYLIMRRLEQAKRAMLLGESLASAAAEAGFADQAHFTRHFRKAFGMTPGRWLFMHDDRGDHRRLAGGAVKIGCQG